MLKKIVIIPVITVLVIAVLAVGFSAFTKKVESKIKLSDFDYEMTSGDQTNPSDRINPANYTQESGTISCPMGSDAFCKIHATDNGSGKPIIANGSALYNALNASGSLPAEVPGVVWLRAD